MKPGTASASRRPPTAVAGRPWETSSTRATVAIPSPTYDTKRAVHSERNAALRPRSPQRPLAGGVLTSASRSDGRCGQLRVQRVALGERPRPLAELGALRVAPLRRGESLADHLPDLVEVVELEAARGERRRADPQPRRDRRRP